MQILNASKIKLKIQRLAYQIAEDNWDAEEILLIGINTNGLVIAKMIDKVLKKIEGVKTSLHSMKIDLNQQDWSLKPTIQAADNAKKTLVIVDDVANSGKTIFYGFQLLFDAHPSKLQIAVLIDRKHKRYPIHVDYVGMSLATTLAENILVHIEGNTATSATLS